MAEPRTLIDSLREQHGMFSWEGQRLQYDQLGPPGEIVYQRYEDGSAVDVLLYYSPPDPKGRGRLIGILNHYPDGASNIASGEMLEPVGSCNVFIHPTFNQDDSVLQVLWTEARRRWNVRKDVGPAELQVGRIKEGKLATSAPMSFDVDIELSPSDMDGNRRLRRPNK